MSEYLPLSAAAAYVGRHPRWLRRRLGEIAHYKPDHSGLLFRKEDLDSYLSRFRVEPLDLDEVVCAVLGSDRKVDRGKSGRFQKRPATVKSGE